MIMFIAFLSCSGCCEYYTCTCISCGVTSSAHNRQILMVGVSDSEKSQKWKYRLHSVAFSETEEILGEGGREGEREGRKRMREGGRMADLRAPFITTSPSPPPPLPPLPQQSAQSRDTEMAGVDLHKSSSRKTGGGSGSGGGGGCCK